MLCSTAFRHSRTLLRNKTVLDGLLDSAKCFEGKLAPNMRLLSTSQVKRAPGERRYSEKHEWVSLNGKVGTVGISNYAQEALGDIVYAQLPDVDSEYEKEDECGALESVKAASDVYSPVSGRIVEKNEDVENDPSLINKSPYEKGWLFKIELKTPKELEGLMDEANYEKFLKAIAEEKDD